MNFKIFRNKNIVLVVLGQLVSGFGTYMQNFALSLYVLEKTDSAALFASVLVVSAIPRILLTPFAGVLADRFSRKKIVVIMDIISGISVAGIGAIFLWQGELSIFIVYAMVLILTIINVLFEPAMQAMIPDLVEKDQLVEANSTMEAFGAILAIGVPLVSGVLYATFGIFPLIVANSISFFASAFSESFIKIAKESIVSDENKEKFMTTFMEGIHYIRRTPEFIIMIGVAIIANFAMGPIISIAMPAVILLDFGMSEAVYGTFASLMTLGMLIGPIFAAKIIRRQHYSKMVFWVLLVDGLLSVLLAIVTINGLFPSVWYNAVIMLVLINIIMITVVWVNLALRTARQIMVPGDMLGRVTAVIGTFAMMSTPLGQAVMGGLLETMESPIIIAIYAGIVILSSFVAKIGFNKLDKAGKMDMTIGVESKQSEVTENE